MAALEASEITGVFKLPVSTDRSSALREKLDNHSKLKHEIVILRSSAEKETQINRRVELNLEIKKREDEISSVLRLIKLE
jgi:glycine cleavage system regulatory protein